MVEMRFVLFSITIVVRRDFGVELKIKRVEHCSTLFPKSYHELNLLMLWSYKHRALIKTEKRF